MHQKISAFFGRTGKFLRKVFLSVPALVAAGIAAAYVLGGFFLAPVLAKWQIEKQVHAKLAHRITLGELRINPLKLTAEASDVELRDPAGGTLIGFGRLFVDFEARSVIDRAWTFAAVTLEQPAVHIELDKAGKPNFLRLVEALQDPAQDEEGPLPRLVVQRLSVQAGRIEYRDRRLPEPLVTRATPVEIELTDLSTLPSASSPYRMAARTATGETLRWSGTLRLNPLGFDGKLALNGLRAETLARALHEHFSVAAPAGRFDLVAEYRVSYEAGTLSGGVERLEIQGSDLSLTAPGASSPLLALDTVSLAGARVDLGKREVAVSQLTLGKGRLALNVDAAGKADWQRLAPGGKRAPDAEPSANAKTDARETEWSIALDRVEVADVAVKLSDAAGGRGAELAAVGASFSGQIVAGAGSARIALDRPKLAISGGAFRAGNDRIAMPTAAYESATLSVAVAGSRLEIRSERPKVSLAQVAIEQGERGVEAKAYSLAGERLATVASPGKLELRIDAPRLAIDGVMVRQGDDLLDLRSLAFQGEQVSVQDENGGLRIGGDGAQLTLADLALKSGENGLHAGSARLEGRKLTVLRAATQTEPARIEATLEGAGLALAGLAVKTRNGESDRARIGKGRAGAALLTFATPVTGAAVSGEGLSAELSGVVIRDPRTAEELAQIGRAQLAGGSLRTSDRMIAAESMLLADGGARIVLDASGRLNWARLAPDPAPAASAKEKDAAPGAPAWRIAVKAFDLSNFGVAFTDAGHEPPAAIALHGIQARLADIDTGGNAAASLDLRAKVRQGGEIAISGALDPRTGKSDLKVTLDALALAPAQPYLARFAHLALASGTLSSEGRLRYGDAAAGANVVYEGSAVVDQFVMEEIEPRRPFLAWESVAASELALTVSPHRLDISELRISAPEGRLIIAEDQSANFSRLLKKPGEAGAPEEPDTQARAEDAFPVSVGRIRVERGVLDFADFSLRPRFGARMHDLQGVVTGFGTGPDSRAKLDLGARVDRFGSAKIVGEISALHPEAYTDVNMAFRNLEMTALTPYVAKFAGYRIAGGRLSVDLDYRIKDSVLVGENRIVLNKLQLGEKIESPDALDLPLELAIALLQDARGVIDLGVPVTGNLGDPQFDYGEVIAKAVGNLIGGIVTAPFRALGALFGGGSGDLGSIEFAPGVATLVPPEREKLATVARALENRPQLRLIVVPAFAADEDLSALKSAEVRREILARTGIKLAPGEEPGPVDVTNARTQRAVEAMFAQRHSSTLLEELKQRQGASKAGPGRSGEDGKSVPGALHRVLLERLISEQPVSEAALRELAGQRGAAIVKELTSVGGVEPARISLGEAQGTTGPAGEGIPSRLELAASP